jgi:hypothetical protein
MLPAVNFLAVLAAAVVALIVGFVYYLPPIMGLRWGNLIKSYAHLTDEDLNPKNPLPFLVKWLITAFINAYVLAGLFAMTGTETIGAGIMLAVVLWLGYGLTFSSWPVIFARQPTGVWFINNGGFLLMQVGMAVVLMLLK